MNILKIKQKSQSIEAVQWLGSNAEEVLPWLSAHGIGYTFHEIMSAGKLIIYPPGCGPLQIQMRNFIIRTGPSSISTCTPEVLNNEFEVINEETVQKNPETN